MSNSGAFLGFSQCGTGRVHLLVPLEVVPVPVVILNKDGEHRCDQRPWWNPVLAAVTRSRPVKGFVGLRQALHCASLSCGGRFAGHACANGCELICCLLMAASSALKLLLGSVHKNWNVAMEVVAASSSPYHNFHEATTTITTVHAFVSTTSKLVSPPSCRRQWQQQQRSFSSNKLSLIAFSSLSELGGVKKKATEPRVLHSCSSRFSSSVVGRKQQSWKFQPCEERKLLGAVTRFNNVRLLASFNVPPVFGEDEKSGFEDKDSQVKLLGNQSLKEEEEQPQLLLEERPLGSSGADPYLWEDQFLKDSAKTRQPKPMCYYFTQGLCTLVQ